MMAQRPAGSETAGIYVHIPFCRSKCAYCAFTSYPVAGHDPEAYLNALAQEIGFYQEQAWCRGYLFSSLFIGGGTPTILTAPQLTSLLNRLRTSFAFTDEAEISVEANPDTVDAAKLAALRAAGVNRLSLGIQTFNDATLRRIGRPHTAADGEQAVALAREAGFRNLNLDLIYGLPGQSPTDWRQTLALAVALAPEHLSAYQLSIDPGSNFAELSTAGKLQLPDEECEAEMAEDVVSSLAAANYGRYEISNYARPGYQCRHNLGYWHNHSYLGLGVGAVGCLSGLRLRNIGEPQRYQDCWAHRQPAWLEAEGLDRDRAFRETVVMGLRLLAGLNLAELQNRFGIEPQQYYGATLNKLIARDLLEVIGHHLRLTTRALPVANQVLAELV